MQPLIVAHRANGFGAPENTLPGFLALAKSAIRGVEFDVWLSADRQPVVHHDLYVKVDGQKRAITQLLRRQLPADIPDLAAVAASVAGLDFVNVEIKPGPFALNRIWPYLADANVCVSSFRWQTLAELRRQNKKLRLGLLVYERYRPEQAIATAEALGCEALHLSLWQLGPAWLSAARAAKLPIRVYTANRPWQWKLCMASGVSAIMTDKPLRLSSWLQNRHSPRSRP